MNPLVVPLTQWYDTHARDLPWRAPGTTPWGVLVSEIMLQQTPAARVIPYWETWLALWPSPADLADATLAEVIRAWGTLGYPRRALRLYECAAAIAQGYGNQVPSAEAVLRTLPGIGEYTAAAVAGFAYGQRTVVLDVNVRRVVARAHVGEAAAPPVLTRGEWAVADGLVPTEPALAVTWNQAAMELGAVICRVRNPGCDACPVSSQCAWRLAGYPGDVFAGVRRTQAWEGTDRQARGRIMALLREADGELVPVDAIEAALPRTPQVRRAIDGLVSDGLAARDGEGLRLP